MSETQGTPGGPLPGQPINAPPAPAAVPPGAAPSGAGAVAGTGEVKGKPSKEMQQYLDEGVTADDKGKPEEFQFLLEVPKDLEEVFSGDQAKAYVERAKEVARREGISPKHAQALLQELANLNFDLTRSQLSEAGQEDEQQAQELALAWKREIATDPQLGGTRFTTTMSQAEDGARRLGGHAMAVAFVRHMRGEEVMPGPMLVRALYLAAATMREDRIHGLMMGKTPESKSFAEALYGGKPNNR